MTTSPKSAYWSFSICSTPSLQRIAVSTIDGTGCQGYFVFYWKSFLDLFTMKIAVFTPIARPEKKNIPDNQGKVLKALSK